MYSWDDAHNLICRMGEFCSAHQSENWRHLIHDFMFGAPYPPNKEK